MIIDGRAHASAHETDLRLKIQDLGKKPVLVSFLIGDNPASTLYTNMKQKKAQSLGIDFRVEKLPATTSFDVVSEKIQQLNKNIEVNGIMVQLPLSEEFLNGHQTSELINLINPQKDVDGLREDSPYLPATVRGILSLLKDEGVDLADKTVVVVGAKGEVGSRLVKVLEGQVKELVGVDQETTDLSPITQKADVLISTVGKASLIKAEMVKEGVVIIDVGSNKLPDGKVVGDVDFADVCQKASKITPVPGGVGPMTVISLMENLVEAATYYL